VARGPVVAVVGATGLVGSMILTVLAERRTPVGEIRALAHEGGGRTVMFGEERLAVQPLSAEALDGVDVAFFAATNQVSAEWAPRLAQAGTLVIDKSSRFRLDPSVPLVVPEVNGHALTPDVRLVASPNCSTIQLVLPLAALAARRRIRRVLVSTYQAVSGSGREAVEQLEREVRAWAVGDPAPMPTAYARPIAFNILPQCDAFGQDDFTGEEWKLMREAEKILGRPLALSATAVRVPVPVGHTETVYVELDEPVTADEAREWFAAFAGVRVEDEPEAGRYPTPAQAAGNDWVWVGRVRQDPHRPEGLHFVVVSDNLRKGAATNAVQIWEHVEGR
jgi:aspartate-semialdehyde dehydrogenase